MTKLDMQVILRSSNLCKEIESEELEEMGKSLVDYFRADKNSRKEWEERNSEVMKLVLQVTETKTFPWPGASNVKFPLCTIAALQFHSRAYPALISGATPVAARALQAYPELQPIPPMPQGQQPDPKMQEAVQKIQAENKKLTDAYAAEKKRARRVAQHMSYQILEEDEAWEDQHDKVLLIASILGCAFKKTYFDPVAGHNISECVSPSELVVSYYSKTIETTPRASHLIYLSHNEVRERQVRGVFDEFTEGSPEPIQTEFRQANDSNERQGVTPVVQDSTTPYEFIEVHCWMDLDGDDYQEPYIVTVRLDTMQVVRVVARFTRAHIEYNQDKDRIVRITPVSMFTKYGFIPSPDGGFYDLGFGALLGPINASIDTAINQLLDAGTLSTAGGGFLGRGFKSKKGILSFKPNEWKQVDSSGDDIRKNVFQLPTKEPSPVLFQLLTVLIEYGQQVAGAADILQGKNPGQNTPAETSRTMVEQGMKIFNGIYKRMHRAFTKELRKLYHLNQIFLAADSTYFHPKTGDSVRVFEADYSANAKHITAAASPFYMSDAQKMTQAEQLRNAAHTTPGYDLYAVEKLYLEAIHIDDVEELFPDPKGPNAVPHQKDPKVQVAEINNQVKQGQLQLQVQQFKAEQQKQQMEFAMEIEKHQADIALIRAQIMQLVAEAQGIDKGHEIALLEAQIGLHKAQMEGLLKAHDIIAKARSTDNGNSNAG